MAHRGGHIPQSRRGGARASEQAGRAQEGLVIADGILTARLRSATSSAIAPIDEAEDPRQQDKRKIFLTPTGSRITDLQLDTMNVAALLP